LSVPIVSLPLVTRLRLSFEQLEPELFVDELDFFDPRRRPPAARWPRGEL
jgi:hypothetical protein